MIIKRHLILNAALITSTALVSVDAEALPIGYGYNQGDRKFSEIRSDNFMVYHDDQAPHDGKIAINALEAARPHLERWFQVSRSSPLIVNMSAVSENASFANFITDSIELQTMGQGSRDLAWHEYTHSTMYRHLDNWFGPAGSILHLPWMEAWFLEGLAEAMSVSVGSEEQAGVERYQALHDDWPSWDRIHSLYTSGPFSYRGYATSGAFVSWMLRTYDANKLPDMLHTFYRKSMPWMWPWALVPFNGFLPMDSALKSWTEHSGRELYEQYKAAAKKHWTSLHAEAPLIKSSDNRLKLTSSWSINTKDGKTFGMFTEDGKTSMREISMDPKTGIATAWGDKKEELANSDDVWGSSVIILQDMRVWTSQWWPAANERRAAITLKQKGSTKILKRSATWIDRVWITKNDVLWFEYDLETTKICQAPVKSFVRKNVKCTLSRQLPISLHPIGQQTKDGTTIAIWLEETTQTIPGDRHKILIFDPTTGTTTSVAYSHGGKPLSVAFTPEKTWILMAGRSERVVRSFDDKGACLGSISLADLPTRILDAKDERPLVVTYLGEDFGLSTIPRHNHPETPCYQLDQHSSPLLAAIQSKEEIDLATAMKNSSTWQAQSPVDESEPKPDPNEKAMDAALSSDGQNVANYDSDKKAHWRGRPVLVFPWMGGDDPTGPQIGIISVPLMDHMQNETVRLTALVGLYSTFPYQEAAVQSTRFAPTWTLAVFRSQTYNGRYYDAATDTYSSSYLDERGGHIDGDLQQRWHSVTADWNWSVKSSNLKHYIGPSGRVGNVNELSAGLGLSHNLSEQWIGYFGLRERVVPSYINKEFDYQAGSGSLALRRLLGDGYAEVGVEGGATRGAKRRHLQEFYTPLKTFIAGSGGGYNQNSFALTADQGLFAPHFGDTQARAKFNITHPIIHDIDKFMGLLYFDRLDASAFINHGGAWSGNKAPSKDYLSTAHGYSLDLFMDNKGFRLNTGLGVGQVIGNPFQSYYSLGFDAFF